MYPSWLGAVNNKSSIPTIPTGLIIPYNGGAAPSGWDIWSDADDAYIVGAGSTYSVADTGGSLESLTNSETSGSHTSAANFTATSGAGSIAQGSSNLGNHSHPITLSGTPKYQDLKFIQANTDLNQLPQDGIVLSASALSGPSNILGGNGFLKANTTQATGGDNATIGYSYAASSDSHGHSTAHTSGGVTGGAVSNCYEPVEAIDTNTGSGSLSNASIVLKKLQLSAWSDAAADFNLESGMIAMWESLTPPDGWNLCDGTNGTPDLRDHFIELVNSGSENTTSSGNNKISVGVGDSINHDWIHDHRGTFKGSGLQGNTAAIHTSINVNHTHNIVEEEVSFIPPYYALAFIMIA